MNLEKPIEGLWTEASRVKKRIHNLERAQQKNNVENTVIASMCISRVQGEERGNRTEQYLREPGLEFSR